MYYPEPEYCLCNLYSHLPVYESHPIYIPNGSLSDRLYFGLGDSCSQCGMRKKWSNY